MMRNPVLIVSMLLPAYLLLVLHSVIPHHHHVPKNHGPVHYHHGTHVHPEDQGKDSSGNHEDQHEDHGPTAHFVHAPEFGNAMVKPGVKWIDIVSADQGPLYFLPADRARILMFTSCPRFKPPEIPIFCQDTDLAVISLRGPPPAFPGA